MFSNKNVRNMRVMCAAYTSKVVHGNVCGRQRIESISDIEENQ
jgi:hypothetical protein